MEKWCVIVDDNGVRTIFTWDSRLSARAARKLLRVSQEALKAEAEGRVYTVELEQVK